jgi:hypothetical protein
VKTWISNERSWGDIGKGWLLAPLHGVGGNSQEVEGGGDSIHPSADNGAGDADQKQDTPDDISALMTNA